MGLSGKICQTGFNGLLGSGFDPVTNVFTAYTKHLIANIARWIFSIVMAAIMASILPPILTEINIREVTARRVTAG